ncbi:hypothetical protein ACFOWT_10860 [Croceibacterium xixiisoli]|uniref:hypothetical protein n=1 Tax=Croceibacterium xixiisoli TaxID=1476466 RepID=UPI003607AAC5
MTFDRGRVIRVLVLPALFEEANKLRHFTVATMRLLDQQGIDCFLPDLPGCNESLAPLQTQTLTGWQADVQRAITHFGASHVLALRGGAMIAPAGYPGWALAPIGGAALLRAMLRARVLASREAGREETRESLLETGRSAGLELGGWQLGPRMIHALESAQPLATLRRIAQEDLGGGGALWLRAEPDHNPQQAAALATIIAGRPAAA